jgi:citrate synthase
MTYDPAFMNTASCRSTITFIDGDRGIVRYRGCPIEVLAEHCTFLARSCLPAVVRRPARSSRSEKLGQRDHLSPSLLASPIIPTAAAYHPRAAEALTSEQNMLRCLRMHRIC